MPTLGIASRGRLSNAPMLGIQRWWSGWLVGWFGDVQVGVLIEVTVEVWRRPVLSQSCLRPHASRSRRRSVSATTMTLPLPKVAAQVKYPVR